MIRGLKMIKESTARELNIDGFISGKIGEIKEIVGDEMAINALSGELIRPRSQYSGIVP